MLKYSIRSLKQRHIRSWLTMLGIVIGIAAVFSLLTIGQGFNAEIEKQLSSFGTNTIFVSPVSESQTARAVFSGPGNTLTSGKLFEKDAERLKKIPEIEDITRLIIGSATVGFKDKQISSPIRGIEPGLFEKTTLVEIASGRFLVENDQRVVVVGASIAEDSFGTHKIGVNSILLLNGKKFRVVGIMKKAAGGFGPSSQTDTAIIVPFKDAQLLFKDSLAENEIGAIAVKVSEGTDIDAVTDKISFEMAASHKVRIDQKDFSVINPKTLQERIGSIVGLVTTFLGAIASISLIVGGVGIANSMLTSVIERTHEIGVLKSVGSTKNTILHLFIIESGALGGVGGAIGIILGLVIVNVVGLIGIPFAIKLETILFTQFFSIIIGVSSGWIPAKRAAELSPVDALRYE